MLDPQACHDSQPHEHEWGPEDRHDPERPRMKGGQDRQQPIATEGQEEDQPAEACRATAGRARGILCVLVDQL